LRLFSFFAYGFALSALALVLFGAYDSYPNHSSHQQDNLYRGFDWVTVATRPNILYLLVILVGEEREFLVQAKYFSK